MKARTLLSTMTLLLLLAACGGGGSAEPSAPTGVSPETTPPPTTTTTPTSLPETAPPLAAEATQAPTTATLGAEAAQAPTTATTATTLPEATPSDPGSAYTTIENLIYLSDGRQELKVDAYVPAGQGPFPVAILFHGMPSSKDELNQSVTAAAAAEAGMLTFVPNWNPTMGPMSSTILRSATANMACALAFTEQEAPSYGGDPARVVTSGFSAGSPGAAWLALGHEVDLSEGCFATEIPHRPVGAMLGDSEYFFHTAFFDRGFTDDLAGMQEFAAEIIDPASWPEDLSARFRIWYAESSMGIRSFEDAWAEDGWLAARDPDGSIREDLDDLGLLDDGIISYIDESELLAYRLRSIGLDATAHMHPGSHVMLDKTDELVAYLLDAAGVD